jgi:hypothetical protein
MPTGSWIVRLLGKTGSDRRTVKVTRMTHSGLGAGLLAAQMQQRSHIDRRPTIMRPSLGL